MNWPCYYCKDDRHIGCHASCEKYAKAMVENNQKNRRNHGETAANMILFTDRLDRISRYQRGVKKRLRMK